VYRCNCNYSKLLDPARTMGAVNGPLLQGVEFDMPSKAWTGGTVRAAGGTAIVAARHRLAANPTERLREAAGGFDRIGNFHVVVMLIIRRSGQDAAATAGRHTAARLPASSRVENRLRSVQGDLDADAQQYKSDDP